MALSWDRQEMHLTGMDADPTIPFSFGTGPGEGNREPQPARRQAETGGADVIDISSMIADLEANPAARNRA